MGPFNLLLQAALLGVSHVSLADRANLVSPWVAIAAAVVGVLLLAFSSVGTVFLGATAKVLLEMIRLWPELASRKKDLPDVKDADPGPPGSGIDSAVPMAPAASTWPAPWRPPPLTHLLHRAGVSIGIHQLRHAHATELTDSGVSIDPVRRRLGHASTETTQIYTPAGRQDRRR